MLELYQLAAITMVLAMMLAALWWLKGRGAIRGWPAHDGAAKPVTCTRTIALTPQHRLHVVEFLGRDLLVATYPSGCTLIDGRTAARPPRAQSGGDSPVGPARSRRSRSSSTAVPGAVAAGTQPSANVRALRDHAPASGRPTLTWPSSPGGPDGNGRPPGLGGSLSRRDGGPARPLSVLRGTGTQALRGLRRQDGPTLRYLDSAGGAQ